MTRPAVIALLAYIWQIEVTRPEVRLDTLVYEMVKLALLGTILWFVLRRKANGVASEQPTRFWEEKFENINRQLATIRRSINQLIQVEHSKRGLAAPPPEILDE